MPGLLNKDRPRIFCPGCSHERIVQALDQALQEEGLSGKEVALVSDIGCSGLFDTYFMTHALHGLHGRALTYAAGLKLARPDLKVIVTMGDGGLGIGGAHLLAACRRNLDLTLLVLNNFNFGMTGGQFSATTPKESTVGSSFLNSLEFPMDLARVAASAGAPFVLRSSAYSKDLPEEIRRCLDFQGFSLIDIHGICTGRYTKRNSITPKSIEESLNKLPQFKGKIEENDRPEYLQQYQKVCSGLNKQSFHLEVEPGFAKKEKAQKEVVILGAAGQRVVTAGELLCIAGMIGGLRCTQKNDYPITVLRGHSVSEVILSPDPIHYTGINRPYLVLALSDQGVQRKKALFAKLSPESRVLKVFGVELPETKARVDELDFKAMGVKEPDWALGTLAHLASQNELIDEFMLLEAVKKRFKGKPLESSKNVIAKVAGD